MLQILAFALLGTCVIAARGYALLSLGRLRAMMISNAIALSVVFGAGIPLISAHGATGGAIALTAAELTLALSYEVSLTRGRPQLRPSLGFVARVACAAGLAVLPAILFDLSSLAETLIGAVIYALALLVLRAVPVELRQALFPNRHPAAGGTPE